MPDGAPGAQGTDDKDKPALTPYLVPAAKATGAAVIVCPGGSYVNLSMDPATGAPTFHNHEVAEEEVIDILEKPGEDRAGREGSRIALGQTASGRYLRHLCTRPRAGQPFSQLPLTSLSGSLLRRIAGVERRNVNEPDQVSRRMG
jgi:hypothetical protein